MCTKILNYLWAICHYLFHRFNFHCSQLRIRSLNLKNHFLVFVSIDQRPQRAQLMCFLSLTPSHPFLHSGPLTSQSSNLSTYLHLGFRELRGFVLYRWGRHRGGIFSSLSEFYLRGNKLDLELMGFLGIWSEALDNFRIQGNK